MKASPADSSCTGKKRFESFAGAAQSARHIRRINDDACLHAYACRHCHGFHIGETISHERRVGESAGQAKRRLAGAADG